MRVDQKDFRNGTIDGVSVRLVTHAEEVLDHTGVASAGLQRIGLRDDEALLPHDLSNIMRLDDLIFLAEFFKFQRVSNRLGHNDKGLIVHGKGLSKRAPQGGGRVKRFLQLLVCI